MPAEAVVWERSRVAGASRLLFGLAILSSAFFLFLVQPLVGKRVIPLFGGAPGVWTLCLAFYQSALFLGYAYAHLLVRFGRPALQLGAHAIVVLLAARIAASLSGADFSVGEGEAPEQAILRLLLTYVGLPFFVLASTGPLLQAWFARRHPTRSPYPLYALSNLGSFAALFAYPFWIEPQVGLLETMEAWSFGFFATGSLLLVCGAMALRFEPEPERAKADGAERTRAEEPAPLRRSLWLLLSGTAVVVMMSITNHLCRDIASVPFLWILPLAAYLASFIVSFSFEGAYRRGAAVAIVLAALGLGAVQTLSQITGFGGAPHFGWASLPVEIGRLTALVFGVCWILHGELHAIRAHASELTLYYLLVSLGGALGGLFVGIAAPWLFSGHGELVVGAVLACGLVAWVGRRQDPSETRANHASARPRTRVGLARARATWGAVVLLAGLEIWIAMNPDASQVYQARNFFGVLRVLERGEGPAAQRVLLHGSTTHGLQFVTGANQGIPTSYYGRGSALAAALSMRAVDRPARLGVVGLGIGTVAAYGRHRDRLRFYEIDPGVVAVAEDARLFTFLRNSAADIEIEVGDARLLLEEERREGIRQDFDLLLVDAFSSDAVPVHLMTKEGFAPYLAALADDGLLLVHLSSRHFDLGPVVSRIAGDLGLPHVLVDTRPMPALQTQGARWALLAKDPSRIAAFRTASSQLLARHGLPATSHRIHVPSAARLAEVALWTDDYSDLFGALRR